MMDRKYELVAWTRNVTDNENCRLYLDPSVELELIEPLVTEVSECRKIQRMNDGFIDHELAARFVRVYEQSARLDVLTGQIDSAIKFFLKAADYCVYGDEFLRQEFSSLCEEAVSLAVRHDRFSMCSSMLSSMTGTC